MLARRAVVGFCDSPRCHTSGSPSLLHCRDTPCHDLRQPHRDFGEHFVPGYKRISTVDYLLNSLFRE